VRDAITILQTDDVRWNSLVGYVASRRLDALHNGQDDYEVQDTQKDSEKWDRVFLLMKLIVGLLAGVALLVGGIGVMNVMLVGMNERRREIGIRRATGATAGDIATQFIVEAVLLAGGGGVAGGAAGLAIATLAGRILRAQNASWVVTPARRAAALDPVIAMRG
jgi:putative ABC transport system permease protein